MPIRVVFLGSKPIGYQCLQHLITQKELLNIEIVGVRTQFRQEFAGEHNLKKLAEENKIPLIASLDELPECDIIYSVQHNELLKQAHIDKASVIAVNLHLAPLPEYRGCNQFSFAIMDNASEFGVTIHEIDTRIDHGDILFEHRFPVPENCWVDQLYDLTVKSGYDLFRESLSYLLKGAYNKIPQSDLLKERSASLHYRNEIHRLKHIDLNASKAEIERKIRATYMPGFEPPFCIINGQKVFFKRGDDE